MIGSEPGDSLTSNSDEASRQASTSFVAEGLPGLLPTTVHRTTVGEGLDAGALEMGAEPLCHILTILGVEHLKSPRWMGRSTTSLLV